MVYAPLQPDRLWQQNHCGIYRFDRPGDRWERDAGASWQRADLGFPSEQAWWTVKRQAMCAALASLGAPFPGFRFRVVDEQGRIRRHIKLFVREDLPDDLDAPIRPGAAVTFVGALSGG